MSREIIYQAFNQTIQEVKEKLYLLAEQGFTVVQLSPLQQHKEPNNPTWWLSYQVTNFKIGNRLGNKDQLKELCDLANKLNIRIIVDCVFNHVANNGGGEKELEPSNEVDSIIREREDFFHKPAYRMVNDKNRYDCTQFCIGLPDLNTSNHELQNIMIEYLKDLISCGVKGFRFDAAKHIELPTDEWCGSDFWERVLGKLDNREELFIYGEVLDVETWLVDEYSKYMMVGVNNNKGTDNKRKILWTFSHDDDLTFNLKREKDWNVILNEWEWILREHKESHMLFYPTNEAWKTERMKYINKTHI